MEKPDLSLSLNTRT